MAQLKKYGLYTLNASCYGAIIESDIEKGVNGYYIKELI
jgi:hypothetical protein